MMAGHDFVVFSDDWGRHPFSCQHVMRHFLPANRLLWVNTIGLRLPRPSLYDVRRAAGKVASWLAAPPSEPELPGLRVISPVMIPFNPLPPVRAFNRHGVVRAVRAAMREWNMTAPILLATVPNAADYLGHIGERLVVYYCVDDFSVWPGMNLPTMVRGMEERLVAEADLILAVSRELQATRQGRRGPTRLLTHGVDVEHFRQAAASQPRPAALADMAGPIIGFYGLIDTHLDLDIVRALVERRSDWSVVLIGTARVDLGELATRPNFRWLPAVPYADLPRYASAFDVAIVPYVLNWHTRTANPLKFKEYLATGKPVVSTPMAEVVEFSDLVLLARGPEEFTLAVERALRQTVRLEDRLDRLAGQSWRDKAGLVSDWIGEALGRTRPRAGEGA
ncbi:MAG: glycosyltransferase family 1 protein [Opitutae bacterium]|nr:glycosyltransferase family 1 protein [Opitutae bacterium]